MKIRARLSSWYVVVTFVILLVFSLGTYFGMRHLLFKALAEERELLAHAIEQSYDPQSRTFRNLELPRLHVSRHMKESYLIIYNAGERPVYRSPMADELSLSIPLTQERIETTTILRKTFSSFSFLQRVERKEVAFQAASRQLYYNNQRIGWVNIAAPISDIEASMQGLLKILLGGILVVGLLVGGGTYVLTDKALAPVAAITRKARRISSSNLNERIDVLNHEDELGQLATVLNDLLNRLQQAFESQRQFMADAAHELNTPLAILRAHWEDELDNPQVPQGLKEKMVHDVETISRMNRLINNLLFLSRTESHGVRFDSSPLSLSKLVRDVLADAQVLATMKGQDLQADNLTKIEILGDRDRLYQLFFNLVDNAIKYSDPNGKIRVTLSSDENNAIFSVRDNGPGIPADNLPHIFDRFYRVNKDRSRKTGGSGLGLAICRMIAEAHHGSIDAESVTGEGSAFVVTLPLDV